MEIEELQKTLLTCTERLSMILSQKKELQTKATLPILIPVPSPSSQSNSKKRKNVSIASASDIVQSHNKKRQIHGSHSISTKSSGLFAENNKKGEARTSSININTNTNTFNSINSSSSLKNKNTHMTKITNRITSKKSLNRIRSSTTYEDEKKSNHNRKDIRERKEKKSRKINEEEKEEEEEEEEEEEDYENGINGIVSISQTNEDINSGTIISTTNRKSVSNHTNRQTPIKSKRRKYDKKIKNILDESITMNDISESKNYLNRNTALIHERENRKNLKKSKNISNKTENRINSIHGN